MAQIIVVGYDLNHLAWTFKGWYLLSVHSGNELSKSSAENFTTLYLKMSARKRIAYAEEIWYVLRTVFFNGIMSKENDFNDEEDALSMLDDWSMYELSSESFNRLIENF